MSTPHTRQVTAFVLAHIQAAQDNLTAAAALASDLQGWAYEWQAIGDAADAIKRLWHACNNSPAPVGHDYDPPADTDTVPVRSPHRCMDLKPHLKD